MITGFGVAEVVKKYYSIHGKSTVGKRAVNQRLVNTGMAVAFYLS